MNNEGKNIWLRSFSSNGDTFIDGENTRRGIALPIGDGTINEGFTIQNCSADPRCRSLD